MKRITLAIISLCIGCDGYIIRDKFAARTISPLVVISDPNIIPRIKYNEIEVGDTVVILKPDELGFTNGTKGLEGIIYLIVPFQKENSPVKIRYFFKFKTCDYGGEQTWFDDLDFKDFYVEVYRDLSR